MPRFEHRFEVDRPVGEVFAWHARPGAFGRLTPPWESVRVLRAPVGLLPGSRMQLEIRKGPVPLRWEVEHTAYEEGRFFVDEQVHGPFARWRHDHRFEPLGPDRCRVEDIVEWGAPLEPFGDTFTESFITRSLERLFAFRARRTNHDLELHHRYGPGEGRVIAVTGSTGLIGTALCELLTSGGYRVLRVTRSLREGPEWVHWDPHGEGISTEARSALDGIFGVVNLAGEPISGVRWTSAKKEAILRSREEGTLLLCRVLAELERPPEVLVSASAMGYYGDRGEERLSESSEGGEGFLAEVSRRWERATHAARAIGIRTVHLRSGMVLSPGGGALQVLLIPFRMGAGGRLGSGRQYISWIDLDDETGLILHALRNEKVRGALNGVAPAPLPNAAFADILGRVLGRPTLVPVPALAIRAGLGEMGKELLLFGQRAQPDRAFETGYRFRYPDLESSLRHQLGRDEGGETTDDGGPR